jgi:methylmalonyl-CoA mutase N-terminal domain/subunit
MEREAEDIFAEINRIGGVPSGIESGWFQRQIAQSAYRHLHEVEQRRRVIVGVTDFVDDEDHEVEVLRVSDEADAIQRARMAQVRSRRDNARVEQCLEALQHAATREANVIAPMLDCARAYCTLYEIRHALEEVYGAYREPVFF